MTEKPTAFEFTVECRPRPVKALRDDEVAVNVASLMMWERLARDRSPFSTDDVDDFVKSIHAHIPKPTLREELAEAIPSKFDRELVLARVLPILRKHGIDLEARA